MTGGAVGSPLGMPADGPLTVVWAVVCDATEGAVGDPPHQADARAHTTANPSFRGEQGETFKKPSVALPVGDVDRKADVDYILSHETLQSNDRSAPDGVGPLRSDSGKTIGRGEGSGYERAVGRGQRGDCWYDDGCGDRS